MIFVWLFRLLPLVVFSLLVFVGVRLLFLRPALDRPWKVEHSVLPEITVADSLVQVKGVRSFVYTSATEFEARWVDRTYDLRELETVWFVLSPFREDWRGPAHSFLSFGFADSTFVSISVEARKEEGESYSIWAGLVNRYELLYVMGEETDLVALRAVHWGDDVYVYPIATTRERVRTLFLDMVARAQALADRPEFYNTAWNNCTTNLYDHVEEIAPGSWSWDWRLLLPGYADELPYERRLIATDLSLAEARARYRVNDKAQRFDGDPRFSVRIRE